MWFSTFVLKNLARRPLRSVLTIIAIGIAICSVVALVGIATGFEHSFMQIYESAGVDMVVVRAGARQRLNSTLDEALGDKMAKIPGVRAVLPGMADVISFEEVGLYGVIAQGWIPGTPIFDHITITEGRVLKPGDRRAILLGTILARNLEKKVGDSVELIEKEPFTIVGVYQSSNVLENGALVVPLTELQRIMDKPRQVTGFSIILEHPHDKAELERVRHEVEALAPNLAAMTSGEHVRSISEVQMAKGMAWLTSTIALVIGLFGVMNTMAMSVHERTREIGILRALGWRLGRVIRMILLEAVLLSIVGAVIGTVGAILLLRLLTRVSMVNGIIEGHINPTLVGYAFLIAIGVGLVGGVLPASRAARMMPTEALRHE